MKKILIVEDVELNRELLVQLLEDNFSILSAADGQMGVQLTIDEQPDLILMDMSLPVLNGWNATRKIKSMPNVASIPIIGLSAHAMKNERDKAMAAGCFTYLTKPIDEDLLLESIAQALNLKE